MKIQSFSRSLTVLILGGLLLSAPITYGVIPTGEDERAQTLQKFMKPNAGIPEFLALSSEPELLKNRRVQMKVFRSLGAKDVKTFQAALALCMQASELRGVPMIYRRFGNTFLSPKLERQEAILDLAASHPVFLKELALVGLIATTLRDQNSTLSKKALSLVHGSEPLQRNPAIAQALGDSSIKLPDYEVFKSKVEPILRTSGEDGKACLNCHAKQPALRLSIEETASERQETVKNHYLSALLMINLENPGKSMLLRKPTNPGPKKANEPPSLRTHRGGSRFEKDSLPYNVILDWIRTGKP